MKLVIEVDLDDGDNFFSELRHVTVGVQGIAERLQKLDLNTDLTVRDIHDEVIGKIYRTS